MKEGGWQSGRREDKESKEEKEETISSTYCPIQWRISSFIRYDLEVGGQHVAEKMLNLFRG